MRICGFADRPGVDLLIGLCGSMPDTDQRKHGSEQQEGLRNEIKIARRTGLRAAGL